MFEIKGVFSTIKVLPVKSYFRVCKVDGNDVKMLTSEGNEIISSEILLTEENPTSLVIDDYKPGLYKKVVFKTPVKLRINGSDEQAKKFRDTIKSHLKSAKITIDLEIDIIEDQADQIIAFLATYKFDTFRKQYRADVRKKVIEFYPAMLAFLDAKTDTIDGDRVELKFGNLSQKNFTLPTPLGPRHMINALSDFFLDYYNSNKPVKTSSILTKELISTNTIKISDGEINYDQKLIDLSYLTFHFELLRLLQTFKQFPASQRPSFFNLTERQGIFIIKVLHLIDFDSFKKASFEIINPYFAPLSEKMIKPKLTELRLKMKEFKEHYSNQSFYTI